MVWFVRQESLACIFPWSLLLCMVLTKHIAVPGIPRYDAILLFALILQYALYRMGWESDREVKVIATFHILGLLMELYKTSLGCWAYPEYSWLRIGRVPIYSGFLYASVASYCCQAWRRLDLQIKRWPPAWEVIVLACAIYGNFFTERRLGDMRWALIPLVFLIFARTTVRIGFPSGVRALPLAVGFLGVGFAIWIAENIGTHTGAWRYPYQQHGWMMVDFGKLSSWFLLIVVTFIIVAQLKRIPKKATAPLLRSHSPRSVPRFIHMP